jgi:hypothetical protein
MILDNQDSRRFVVSANFVVRNVILDAMMVVLCIGYLVFLIKILSSRVGATVKTTQILKMEGDFNS